MHGEDMGVQEKLKGSRDRKGEDFKDARKEGS